MKTIKMILLSFALCGSAWADHLDSNDAGEYVLLNQQQQPTQTYQRYYLQGNQWVMDGKLPNQSWQPVCGGTGVCRLKHSSARQVRQWQSLLPTSLHNMPMACIDNIAFAFCRISKPDNPNQRLYWWFTWRNNRTFALGLNRIR